RPAKAIVVVSGLCHVDQIIYPAAFIIFARIATAMPNLKLIDVINVTKNYKSLLSLLCIQDRIRVERHVAINKSFIASHEKGIDAIFDLTTRVIWNFS